LFSTLGIIEVDKNFISSGNNILLSSSNIIIDKNAKFTFNKEIDLVSSNDVIVDKDGLFNAGNITMTAINLVEVLSDVEFNAMDSFSMDSKKFRMD